jgi:hypothetical protein
MGAVEGEYSSIRDQCDELNRTTCGKLKLFVVSDRDVRLIVGTALPIAGVTSHVSAMQST